MTSVIHPQGSSRPAAVAGLFYPDEPTALKRDVQHYLAAARTPGPVATRPKALIVPHAGYAYSGVVAGHGYAKLRPWADRIHRVILLGPAHRVPVKGLALPSADRFETPLGVVEVDREAVTQLSGLPQVAISEGAHAAEHSLEVHLPFLQQVLGRFTLVPLVVGDTSPERVADVLERLWGGDETLIVISSDLSHYLPYATACAVDRATVDMMLSLAPTLNHEQACGATPINGLLALARRRGLHAELLDLRNSGDTAGDRTRVVGYAALALTESAVTRESISAATDAATGAPSDARGPTLLAYARAAIAERFGVAQVPVTPAPFLSAPGATFVTLRVNGALRGCVGSLQPRRALVEDVRANALAAAFDDPRFPPMDRNEFDALAIEVSLLSPPALVAAASEFDLLTQLRPGIDGLTLQRGRARATFLPQVWESLPDPRDFLAHLKRKAGLPAEGWPDDIAVSRYTVEKFTESSPA